jgi:hypothetical protein
MKLLSTLIVFCLLSSSTYARSKRKHKKSSDKSASTVYFFCLKNLNDDKTTMVESRDKEAQAILVAMETKGEKECNLLGNSKTTQFTEDGWSCAGRDKKNFFSCEKESAVFFSKLNNSPLTYLKYKNKSKHTGIIAYLNNNGFLKCQEDLEEMKQSGVKEVKCFKADSK